MSAYAVGDWVEGGCHCGAVRFRMVLRSLEILRCNCSICAMKGFVNIIVAPEDFELLQGEAMLETYRFNTGVAQHRFCRVCGIHTFTRPRSHPDCYDVNGNCLDGGLKGFTIKPFDGQNWEQNVASIQ